MFQSAATKRSSTAKRILRWLGVIVLVILAFNAGEFVCFVKVERAFSQYICFKPGQGEMPRVQ